MASAPVSSIVLSVFLVFIATVSAQTAPAPAPSGPLNFTAILDKNGQYTYFLRFLADTQVGSQVQNQLNTTSEGFTVFAPTDNAFNNLKPGLINSLDPQKKVQLVLYHVLPKYYSLNDLQFVSNPVRTQATSQNGAAFGLNFTGQNNQVNVSSGMVETQINNALYQKKPLAVYQVDKVLLPEGLFEANSPAASPSPATKKASGSKSNPTASSTAGEPAAADNSGSMGSNMGMGLVPEGLFEANSPAASPSPATKKASGSKSNPTASSTAGEPAAADNSGSMGSNMGMGLVLGLALACMGFLS